MKNLPLILFLFIGTIITIDAQVTALKYLIEYNESTSLYDCKIVISSGSAMTYPQRVQFNAQYTVVVPTGAQFAIQERHNPLEENQFYTGTIPNMWDYSSPEIAPPAQPQNDFYAVYPNLSPVSAYNNLVPGDTVTLFSLFIDVDPCENSIRPFINGEDPSSLEMPSGGDFSNGFTIGTSNQIYTGNASTWYFGDWEIALSDYETCANECVELTPELICSSDDLTYLWSTGEDTPSITVCPTENTTYSVEITNPNMDVLNISTTVEVVDLPIVALNGPNEICVGGTTNVIPNSGGNWTSNNPVVATVTNGGVVTGTASGVASLTFTDTTSGCISESIEVFVNPLPVATITGPDSICVFGTTTLTPSTGGTWISSNPVVGTIDNSGNATGLSEGTVVFTFTNTTTGCSSLPSDTLWVFDDPDVAFIGEDRLCIGETSSVSPNNGGTWVSNTPGVATIVASTGIITAVSQGSATFTFTDASTGCTATTSGLIVDPVPSVSTDFDSICITSTAILAPASGGVWTALNPTIASLAGFTVTGVSSGDAGFLFTSDATGCVSDTLLINVGSGSITTLTGPNQICIGNTTNIEPSTGGSWSSSDSSIASIDNFGTITGVGSGVATFTFTSATTLCASDPSEPVQVTPAPIVIAPSTSLCIAETMNLSPAFGGTWVSNSPAVMSVDAFTGEVTALNEGSATFTFTLAATGCSATTEVVTVNPIPVVEITGPDKICVGETTQLLPSMDGIWTSSDPGVASIQNTGLVTGNAAGGPVTFTWTDNTTGCTSDASDPITVNLIPETTVIDNELCIGETTQLLPSSGGTWISDDPAIATVTAGGIVQGVGPGVTRFTFTSSISGCSSLPSDIITVNGAISAEITGDAVICPGGFSQMSPTTGGTWTSSDPSVLTITNSGLVTGIALGSATFVFTPTDTACPSFPSDPITVEECTTIATSCEDIDPDNVYCDYSILGQLQGSLLSEDSPGNQPDFLCHSEPGNTVWLGFFALEGDYEIIINTSSCTTPAGVLPGVQVGLYSSCDFSESNLAFCDASGQVDNQIIIPSALLTAGNVYYMFIDGLNNSTCNFDIDVNGNYDNTYCTDLSKVTGTAYIDANENGIYDMEETPLRNVLISLFPGNFSVLTNDEGKYIINSPKGGATLTAQVNEGDWEGDFLTLEDVAVLQDCVEDINFGFVPIDNNTISATLSVSNTIVRCDWETRFFVTVENTGTEAFNGQLEFVFDDKADFFISPIPNLMQSGNTLTAETGELLPFMPREYQITLKMPSGSTNLPILDFKAELKDMGEMQIAEYSYSEQLRCSYDPNDKREYPDRAGADNLTLMDEEIEYTIRFQNNGNDTAFQVKIVDELDPNIDPRSIRVVNSSHSVETCIEDNNLIFLFENIFLVDSMTNYEASQGFVTFRGKAKEGRAEFTPVYNTADIIFDTNIPIITNTTINTLVSVLCTNVATEVDVEICEGDIFEGYEESGIYTTVIPLAYGCDSVVTINLEVQGITYSSQDVEICEGEMIILNGTSYTFTASQEINDTVTNAMGCISNIFNFDVFVNPVLTIEIDTTICEGMEYEGLDETGIYTLTSFDVNTGCDIITTINLEVLPMNDPLCIVGIDDLIVNDIKIYPNPAQDQFFVEGISNIEGVSIYTMAYQKVDERIPENRSNKIALSAKGLNRGIYLIAIKLRNRVVYKKLIVD